MLDKESALPIGVHGGCVVGSPRHPHPEPKTGNHLDTLEQLPTFSENTPQTGQKIDSEADSRPVRSLSLPIGNNAHPTEKKLTEYVQNVQAARREIYKLRRDIGEHFKRVRPCGAYVRDKEKLVTVSRGKSKQSVFYSGVQTCKSVWACPVCSMKISNRRAEEVNHMLTNAIVEDGFCGQFVTLTIPHTVYENLKDLQLIVSDGFRDLTKHPDYIGRSKRGKFLPGIKDRYKVQGFIRTLEPKRKNKGWHPHLHIVFVLEVKEAELLAEFSREIISLWARIIKNSSGKVVNEEDGQDSKTITDISGISSYLNKWNIGKELTQSHRKVAGDSMTPFEIFQYYKQTGNEKYLKLFEHYVLSFHNVKQLTFSKDFKKRFLRQMEEKTDAQACDEIEVEEILLAMDKQMFKEIYAAKAEADFLNLVQYQREDAIDFIFHFFPDVKFNTDANYPVFKLE